MLKTLNNTTFAYADDTAIVVADKNIANATETMQNQLNIATKWSHDNGLIINANKTKAIHIKPPHLLNTNIELIFHSKECLHKNISVSNSNTYQGDSCLTTIEIVNSYKYLGSYIDSNFIWKTHIENLQKKLRKTSYMLYHLSLCAPYSVLRQAYFSLSESYIRHGIAAWGNVKYNSTLQKSQDQILKILRKNQQYNNDNHSTDINTQNNNRQSQISLAKATNVLNVKNIYHTTIIKEFSDNPNFLKQIDHMYNTRGRSQGRFKVNRFLNEYGRNTLSVTLPAILNKLPIHILNNENNYQKTKQIKNFLISLQ